jgi:hypothetical protein
MSSLSEVKLTVSYFAAIRESCFQTIQIFKFNVAEALRFVISILNDLRRLSRNRLYSGTSPALRNLP